VYSLDTDSLTQLTGGETGRDSLVMGLGDRVDLPSGLGSVEFTELRRFVSFDVHRDPTQLPVGISSVLIMAGLIVTLFVTRRRAWIRVIPGKKGEATVEFAALARGEDPGLAKGLDELVEAFSQSAKSTLKR
jgi:cytochrome c biogenesis protein